MGREKKVTFLGIKSVNVTSKAFPSSAVVETALLIDHAQLKSFSVCDFPLIKFGQGSLESALWESKDLLTFLPLRLRAACGPAPFPADSGGPTAAAPGAEAPPRAEAPPPGPRAGTFGAFWPCPAHPARPVPLGVPPAQKREQLGRGARGSGRRPALSGWLPEFALPPALPGAFSARAGRCGGTGSRGSAPGTSLIPRPPWSRQVVGPGPTAAPRCTGWRSCCAARVGKDRPSRGLPGGPRRGQASFQTSGFLRSFPSPHLPQQLGRRAELVPDQGSGVIYPHSGPPFNPFWAAF